MTLRIGTLNCNGLRAAYKKDLPKLLEQAQCDILFLQEIRTLPDFAHTPYLPEHYQILANPAQKPGYSGTLIAHNYQHPALSHQFQWDCLPLKNEGRIIDAMITPKIRLINFYWPSGGEEARQALKIDFLQALQSTTIDPEVLTIVGGDFNIAATDRDLKNWKGNKEQPGCTTLERSLLASWLSKNNLVDTYRFLHPDNTPEEYSWWSYRCNAFHNNVGWRIDTLFVALPYAPLCMNYGFISTPRCSDHALYWVDFNISY